MAPLRAAGGSPRTPASPEHVAIGVLSAGGMPAAVGALAAAFADDPVYRHLVPDPHRRERVLRAILAAGVRDALPFGTVWEASFGGETLGAALWLPPGRFPLGAGRKLRGAPTFLRLLVSAPHALLPVMRLAGEVERSHPDEPMWYLEAVGLVPDAQGRGLGRRVLEPGLARADADGFPCYLETARPDNVGFYERLGFRVEREGVHLLSEGPTHWTMRRPPPTG